MPRRCALCAPEGARIPRGIIRGLSLVELLVAMAIGSIIVLALTGAFVDSKISYLREEQFARMQENGRFVLSTLAAHVRSTGSLYCDSLALQESRGGLSVKACDLLSLEETGACDATTVDLARDHILGSVQPLGYDNSSIDGPQALIGVPAEGRSNIVERRLRGDVLVTWGISGAGAYVSNVPSLTEGDGLATTLELSQGNLALVSDCAGTDVFAVSGVCDGVLEHGVNMSKGSGCEDPDQDDADNPGQVVNATDSLSRAYNWQPAQPRAASAPRYKAQVFPFRYQAFYICCVDTQDGSLQTGTGIDNCRTDPDRFRPSFCTWELGSGNRSQSVVLNVADMRVTYTGDLDGDGQIDFTADDDDPVPTAAWVTSANAWPGVSAAKIELLVASDNDHLRAMAGAATPAKASWPPTAADDRLGNGMPADRRLYERFVSNVALRARTPWYISP